MDNSYEYQFTSPSSPPFPSPFPATNDGREQEHALMLGSGDPLGYIFLYLMVLA